MLQGLAVGVLGSLVGNVLGDAVKDKAAGAESGFQIASLGDTKAKAGVEETYNDSMDDAAKAALDALREITSGGIEGFWQWMMKELRKDVMEEMGVSEEDLAAMPPEQKAAVEKMIAEKVQERLKEAMGVDGEGDAAQLKKPEEMIEKLKQAMQNAQGAGYKDQKSIMDALLG